MPQERTEAVVLRGVDFSESSRIVTFLTPDRGRVACLAKGARRKNCPYAAALDTFNRVELVYYWKDGRNVQTLGEAALLDAYPGIKGDLEKSVYAAF
ncbi:MAG TPA: DNA repair protein RecO, partial [Candidatus Hydrogenedentes bacterium]|nr:DNA repair protein RecO [Candidatus Hydrogenedentota bacterium]